MAKANAAAPMRLIMAVMLLLAVVILSMANEGAAQSPAGDAPAAQADDKKKAFKPFISGCAEERPCVGGSSEVPGSPCICSRNCACAGQCILNGGKGEDVQACFIDCVLKTGCVCPKPDN